MNQALLERESEPPTLEEMAELFEFLDEDYQGMISAENLVAFLETTERLKTANFEHKNYFGALMTKTPAL